jgi:hypothetical protein
VDWSIILIVIVVTPLVLIPAALIWYINVSGIYTVIRETQRRRVARRRMMKELEMAREPVVK